jgi:hypothetical protein
MKKELFVVSFLGSLLIVKEVNADVISPLSGEGIRYTVINSSLEAKAMIIVIVIAVVYLIFRSLNKLIKRKKIPTDQPKI